MVMSLVTLSLALLTDVVFEVSPSTQAAIRYLASTSTLCPLMAVLGAKRPQDVGWQFIVATLWLTLILPVLEMFLLWKGGAMDVGPMRSWLLLILLLVGITNYLLTRFAIAATMYTIGQALLLLTHLPGHAAWAPHFVVGGYLIVGACWLFFFNTRRMQESGGWNLVWTEFRNSFGLVWGLRVMERVNEAARVCEWERELTWFGFANSESREGRSHEGKASAQKQVEVERTMRTTLRRFVSPEWIERRHGSL